MGFDDRKQIALVNKTFYYASLHPQFLKNEKLTCKPLFFVEHDPVIDYINDFKQILIRTKRELINLKIVAEPIDHTIFESVGHKIISLCLEHFGTKLTDTFVDTIIRCCINLKSLELKDTVIKWISIKPNKPLLKLFSIKFDEVDMSDKNFNELMAYAPNLQDLSFTNCKILVWPQAIRRFYKNYNNFEILTNFNSDDVFTDVNIINYLKTTKCIKTLRLQQICHIFLELPKHIQLNSLILDCANSMYFAKEKPIDLDKLKLILEKHTTLQQLDISCFPCCLLLTVAKLHKLKYLKVNFTTNNNSVCINKQACLQGFVELLKDMKELRTLILVPWNNIESPSLALPDYTLRSLTSLNCKIQNGLKVMELAKNLTRLQIPNGDILTTNDLQLLFKNLNSLRYLKIHNCIKLDDDILLHSPISNLKGKEILLKCMSFYFNKLIYIFNNFRARTFRDFGC